NEEVLFGGR
nr:RecName: Full=Fibrinogen beta chain; Contains: RecName: Full=Fibrinopeptide B [Erythrocebus patas]prf//1105261C fibrinopeptide B [Erythrocebus patas]